MIDEAFLTFRQVIEKLFTFKGEITDEEMGVRSFIYACEIDSPVELDIVRDEAGRLQIGTTPPLYSVKTTFLPSFHRLVVTAQRSGDF
ncbi:MAG: hypothetical protein CV087_05010 [Candidatus Brocadia sp. WS118]|nr:MAG: hypothetical protein CV087_05010 [Candidatus Brocadia sp. WS118]